MNPIHSLLHLELQKTQHCIIISINVNEYYCTEFTFVRKNNRFVDCGPIIFNIPSSESWTFILH